MRRWNGVLGFDMLVAVLFSAGDIQTALNSPTKYPYFEISVQAVGSNQGATNTVSQAICQISTGRQCAH